jgi:hypothetical protein
VLLSLEPSDRAWLHQRIAQRFEQMLALGFLDEVRALMARGDLHAELPAMRCVGYRQAWQLLEQQALSTSLTAAANSSSCGRPALPPPANWPSASSPGCAACPSGKWCRPTTAKPWRNVLKPGHPALGRAMTDPERRLCWP